MQSKKIICYIVGSIITFGVACVAMPRISKKITNKAYKENIKKKNASNDDDDWGTEFVKKTDEM